MIPDGQSSALLIVSPITQDLFADKTIIVTLSASSSYTLGVQAAATASLLKDGPVIRAGFDAAILDRNDDSSVGPVQIGFDIKLANATPFKQLFVNNNGNVTFDAPLLDYTPDQILSLADIIAPFWADVDTFVDPNGNPPSGVVTYGGGMIDGHLAFGVNWPDVGYYAHHSDKRNTFQLVLIDRSDVATGDFDIEFNYSKIKWETGDVDGTGGFGGYSARAGLSVGGEFYELPGSGVNGAFLDSNTSTGLKSHSLGSCKPGRYVFQVRDGHVVRLPAVVFTPADCASASLSVTLAAPGHPQASIYYTTDGAIPTRASTLYNGPIPITANTQIKAFATEPGLADGPISSSVYGTAAPTPEGCVAWWSAENNMEDHTGRHNGACLLPQVADPVFADGTVGKAFSFGPSAGQPVLVMDDEFMAMTRELTIEGWIKPTDAAVPGTIFERHNEYTVKTAPISGDASHVLLLFQIAGSDSVEATIPVNVWTYFAGVFGPLDSTVTPSRYPISLYINNGSPVQTTTAAHPPGSLEPTFDGIGANSDGTAPFTGLVDELAIYSRALNDIEIKWIYAAAANGKLPIPAAAPLPRVMKVGLWDGTQLLDWDTVPPAVPGETVSFAVLSQGTGLSYEWLRDDQYLANSSTPNLTLSSIAVADQGYYSVKVSNARRTVESWWTHLEVRDLPVVTGPDDQLVTSGDDATFSVVATGPAPLTYQWHWVDTDLNDYLLTGETAATYTRRNVHLADEGFYYVDVFDRWGDTAESQWAALMTTPDTAPFITGQPQNQMILAGNNATFSVTAIGTTPLSYQWQLNDTDISGATASSLTLTSPQLSENYRVIVENTVGTTTSDEARLDVAQPVVPVILTQSHSYTVIVGTDVPLKVSALSAPPTTYQWSKNGNPIMDATTSTLVLRSVVPSDAATYTVVVGNNYGSTPANATLTVSVVPVPPVVIAADNSDSVPATVTLSIPGYPNATIYYTLDGSTPTGFSSSHVGPFTVTIPTVKTITAFATQQFYLDSGFTSAVIGSPDAPTANADMFSVQQDDPGAQLDVMGNDFSPVGNTLTILSLVQPSNGSVTSSGTYVIYQPASGFYGIDRFSYTVSDQNGNPVTATATVFVNKQGNSLPTAQAAQIILGVGQISGQGDLRVGASDPDSDIVSVYSVSEPAVGEIEILPGNGSAAYSRPAGAFVNLTVDCVITDGAGGLGETSAAVANLDSDGDGMPDEWENANGLDPYDPSDALLDIDNDGLPNLAEYLLHTEPQAADNPLNLSGVSMPGTLSGFVTITLPGQSGC
jgi:hypothetical protein